MYLRGTLAKVSDSEASKQTLGLEMQVYIPACLALRTGSGESHKSLTSIFSRKLHSSPVWTRHLLPMQPARQSLVIAYGQD